MCFGQELANAGAGRLSESKAFCEGIMWRAQGTALAFPKTDNPHVVGSPDAIAWDLGWDAAEAGAGGPLDLTGTCCAAVPDIQV